ncbi:hypothetical protein [Bradyrhizobium sp. RDM4]|uniref:hypothetical protein n=1 Tax=Bradyrhizobium sp. RDM4 TaxID=3378765 RepID=UPI0038FCE688
MSDDDVVEAMLNDEFDMHLAGAGTLPKKGGDFAPQCVNVICSRGLNTNSRIQARFLQLQRHATRPA